MFYTNGSAVTKTFHGVTFKPGETKEVFGAINDPTFVHSSIRQEPPKRVVRSRSKSETKEVKKSQKAAKATEPVISKDEIESDLDNSEIVKNKEV